MKSLRTLAVGLAVAACLFVAACSGCAKDKTLHAPTDTGNVGTTALVAYSLEGVGVNRQIQKQPTCATPPVYPCVTQEAKDIADRADEAAWKAAKAADAAGATAKDKEDAKKALDELKKLKQ